MCEIQSLHKVVDLFLEQAISQRWKIAFRGGKNEELVSNGVSIGEAKPWRWMVVTAAQQWKVLNAIVPYTEKWSKGKLYVMCILPKFERNVSTSVMSDYVLGQDR